LTKSLKGVGLAAKPLRYHKISVQKLVIGTGSDASKNSGDKKLNAI
jgi:hypothetical protein